VCGGNKYVRGGGDGDGCEPREDGTRTNTTQATRINSVGKSNAHHKSRGWKSERRAK
jgi:hypothetical protein